MSSTKFQICSECTIDFEISVKEYNRQTKKGRTQFFCSLSCSAKFSNKGRSNTNCSPEHMEKMRRRRKEIIDSSFPQYNYYIRKSKHRSRVKGKWNYPNLDNQYIHDIWLKQNGLCCYTGLPMKLAGATKNIFEMASLDRIDSSIGYMKGNVQFCITAINYAKNDKSDLEIRAFIEKIKGA